MATVTIVADGRAAAGRTARLTTPKHPGHDVNQMVSQSRRPSGRSSRDRLIAAAAAEFAARGFEGAKVDRIAKLARLNKAMLYYHFANKAALYRAILADVFQALGAAVRREHAAGGPPEEQLRRYIRAIAAQMTEHPHLPAIWLREMAEGGRHLDAGTMQHLAVVLGTLGRILEAGHRVGHFRPAHPFVTQIAIVAPLLLFAASAPVRARFRQVVPTLDDVERDAVSTYLETATLAALSPFSSSPAVRRRSSR